MNLPKFRIIPTILKKGPSVVKGKNFSKSRVFSPLLPVLKVFQSRDVDELSIIDVSPCTETTSVNRFEWLRSVSNIITMPLSVGGGIRHIDQISQIISMGADKVILNSACRNNPKLLEDCAHYFGSQSLIASIDIKTVRGKHCVYDSWEQSIVDIDLLELIESVQLLGAGELLITSVNNEGLMQGLDVPILHYIAGKIHIPLIFQGGASSLSHFDDIINYRSSVNAIAAGACFHFTPITPLEISSYLASKGFSTRSTINSV